MNASNQLKALAAGIAAVACIGTAMAQGNPPNPAVSNPAQGAGQQSTQATPMGTTGTPGNGSTMGAGSSTSGSAMTGSSSTGSGTTMGAGSSTDTTSAGASTTTTKKTKVKAKRKHAARSDRG